MELIQNLEDLKKTIDICRKTGVKSLKLGELSLELSEEALFPESAYTKKKKDDALQASIPNPIEEAEKILFWSSFPTTPMDAEALGSAS